ncbi:sulfatase [bacterium M00.F.Ca.ET.141.01.1.1]|nr:MAG: sulfatase [Mesorhizobium sp.]TGS48947.1 sulfatase [Mesorhizobium sp. M8A.F.Ca.ET.182.01.1.1]TGS84354.1 sulfatase [Mesorhizobium sp. M8A.F.Ca.ET.181.01.1.1]TGV55760.1 sulfatase [bacterium M00.F.Ca.ET.141.01.1.1]TIT53038.1 MAG: arylsulfatase [Mesorhizobium sp.]
MSIDRDFPAEAGTTNRITRRDALMAGTAAAVSRFAVPAGLSGALAGLAGVQPAAAQGTPPNIVYIISDDQGWKDVGFHGSDIKTPNIDKLAAEGARLEQFYAQPMCTPTRAALMTGRYPLRYGLQMGVIPSGGGYGLATDEYILPQMLKDAGYKTAMVGKWHLGHAKAEYWPRQRGFDSFYGALVGEIDHFKHASHGVMDWYRNNKPLKEPGYDNTLFGTEAAKVIEKHDGKAPLFLYLAFTAPHSPYQAPEEHIKRYAHVADDQRRLYSAMVSAMDDEIGRVVAELEKKKMRDNTIILFQSDNGGVRDAMFAGESKVGNSLPADNGPYRSGKGTLYEGGTRVCGLVNWPGKVKAGDVNGLIHVTDIYPTLAGLAGAKPTKNKPLDGMDVWETISEAKPSPRTEMVYNVDPTGGAIRQGDTKLVWAAGVLERVELFDLAADKSEKTNLADKNPDKVKELKGKIVDLAKQMAPPLLIGEAIKLTFGAPPISADPATAFNELGD